MDSEERLLHRWAAANTAFLTDAATGALAVEIAGACGTPGMAAMPPPHAERLAFAAIWHALRDYRMPGWRERPIERLPGVLPLIEIVQDWAILTGLSPFAAALSHDAQEALARYEVASLCDRISEEFEIGNRTTVTCWYQAAHREAFRAVMHWPQILSGEDALAEEMMRVAAAAHIARMARDLDPVLAFGREEVAALPLVEKAVRQASKRAIEHQKARNRLLVGEPPR